MNTEQLANDLETLTQDAEDLIKATAGEVSETAKAARSRLMAGLESAKESCRRLQTKAVAGARATDQVIREHPYESIGAAFGLGLLIGVLLGHGRD